MFNPNIKAAPTQYDGYHFESKLEAKWAAFFNGMKIKYEYEPDNIVLKSGQYYAPDFWLEDFKVLVEVKPDGYNGAATYNETVFKISAGMCTNDWAGLLILGDPTKYKATLFCQVIDGNGPRAYRGDSVIFGLDPIFVKPTLFIESDSEFRRFYATTKGGKTPIRAITSQRCSKAEVLPKIVMDIISETRSAKFNYGQSPNMDIMPEWW